MLNLLEGPPQLFQPKKNVLPAGAEMFGLPWVARKTISRSPGATVPGIGTSCVVELAENDASVTPWTIVVVVFVVVVVVVVFGLAGEAGLVTKTAPATTPTRRSTKAAATIFSSFRRSGGSGSFASNCEAASSKTSPHSGQMTESASTVAPQFEHSYMSTVFGGAPASPVSVSAYMGEVPRRVRDIMASRKISRMKGAEAHGFPHSLDVGPYGTSGASCDCAAHEALPPALTGLAGQVAL